MPGVVLCHDNSDNCRICQQNIYMVWRQNWSGKYEYGGRYGKQNGKNNFLYQ